MLICIYTGCPKKNVKRISHDKTALNSLLEWVYIKAPTTLKFEIFANWSNQYQVRMFYLD